MVRTTKRLLLFLSLTLVVFSSSNLKGDFVDGTETFDGTTLDLATWNPFRPDRISQSDELIFTNNTLQAAEYITRSFRVGVGDSVRVEAVMDSYANSSANTLGLMAFFLSSNSSGDSGIYWNDDAMAGVEIVQSDSLGAHLVAVDTGGGGPVIHFFSESILGRNFYMELERLSLTSFRQAGYLPNGQLLAERISTIDGMPDELFVGMASNGNSRWDNVTINGTAIPEPASTTMMLFGSLAMMLKRRNRTSA